MKHPISFVVRAGFIVLLGLFISPGAMAVTIAYDGFAYPPGNVATQNGGTGWQASWFISPLEKLHNRIAETGLTYPNLQVSGGKLLESGEHRSFRYLDTTRPEVADYLTTGAYGTKAFGKHGTTLWIAFLMTHAGGGYGGIHLTDDLGPTVDAFADKKHQRVSLGRNNVDPHFYLGRVTGGGDGAGKWYSTVLCDATVHLVLYRFDFKEPAEEAWMWIDPPLTQEPATEKAALHATNITHFCFNAVSAGGGDHTFDEFRIATSFAEVAPQIKP